MIEHKTDHYYIAIDKNQNLIIIQPIGFWKSISDVPAYLPTIYHAIDEQLTERFSVVYDLVEMKSAPAEVRDKIHVKGVLEILKRKPGATVVVSPESAIARMQVDFIKSNASELPVKHFNTRKEALQFLKEYKTR